MAKEFMRSDFKAIKKALEGKVIKNVLHNEDADEGIILIVASTEDQIHIGYSGCEGTIDVIKKPTRMF